MGDTHRQRRTADLRGPLEAETASSIGYRSVVSVPLGATVRQAVQVMQEHAVGCLVILDGERLAGIFTERSLLARVLGPGLSLDTPVTEVMTPDPVVARDDEPIHVVLSRMQTGRFRHMPVVDATGKVLGTTSIKRSVHFLAEYLPQAILNLADDPEQVHDAREGG